MALLKDEHLLPIGMMCITIAILVDRFLPQDPPLSFLIGMLTGISIVLNITGIIRTQRSRTQKAQK